MDVNEIREEIVIKKEKMKIRGYIGFALLISPIFIVSIGGFINYFEQKDIILLILGILFGLFAISILMLIIIINRQYYLKVSSKGIYLVSINKKEKFIPWDAIELFVSGGKIFSINNELNEIQENQLNLETAAKFNLEQMVAEEEWNGEPEWIDYGSYIILKNEKNINSRVYRITDFCDYEKSKETINNMWIKYVKKEGEF